MDRKYRVVDIGMLDAVNARMLFHKGYRSPTVICRYCNEPVEHDSRLVANAITHRECAVRSIIGGLNHLKGLCSCCGGTLPPDPPELTPRQAAIAACEHWEKR